MTSAFALRVLTALALSSSVCAYQNYIARYPNGNIVPCGSSSEAFGHAGCDSGSRSYIFGQGNQYWSASYCQQDTDGDGKTNGDELGDPCCSWTPSSGSPRRTTDVSHPGEKSSVTSAPSCKVLPPALTGLAAAPGSGAGAVSLSWNPVPATSCVCKLELVVTAVGATKRSVLVAPTATSFTLCGVSNTTNTNIALHAINWGGTTADAVLVVNHTLVPATGTPTCSAPYSGSDTGPAVTVVSRPTQVCCALCVPCV
jgi:hypothetical protein